VKTVLEIENFGPIKSIKMSINSVIVIIGQQSSGKSTIAKVLSYLQWVEKRIVLLSDEEFDVNQGLFIFHHLDKGYINKGARIKYTSDDVTIDISFIKNEPKLKFQRKAKAKRETSKNIFIPSERNFATTIPNIGKYNESNDDIMNFIYDWTVAREVVSNIDNVLGLPLRYEYDKNSHKDYIELVKEKKKILLSNASSGLQSSIPLTILVEYMTKYMYKRKRVLTANDQLLILSRFNKEGLVNNKEALALLSSYYSYSSLIIEEPEQNLFPENQVNLIYSIIKSLKDRRSMKHQILLTTHSPYILYAINNCILANKVYGKLDKDMKSKPFVKARIPATKVSMYAIENGELKDLKNENNLLTHQYFDDSLTSLYNDFDELYEYDD
jgi:ABC-type cobalamin/Fe3+-siderophores transport system ATPase subunit